MQINENENYCCCSNPIIKHIIQSPLLEYNICEICKKEIKDRERIVVNYRFLGSMKVLENLHKICWERLVDIYRRTEVD